MSLVATPAPDFTAKAVMPDNCIEDFTLSSLRGKYVVLFFYPMDFTFVCPTELIAFDNSIEKFRALNTELVSVSVDSEYSHYAWKTTERSKGGVGKLRYPMVADFTKEISRSYGILLNNSVALRGLFLFAGSFFCIFFHSRRDQRCFFGCAFLIRAAAAHGKQKSNR